MRQDGDRVVVTWQRREYAATVVKVGSAGYIVETDEPIDADGTRRIHRLDFQLYDEFDDGRQPASE